MKEITKALSNKVFYDESSNTIIKRYSSDNFKKLFGNQELKVLAKLKFNIKDIVNGEVSMEYIEHIPFDDANITMKDIIGVSKALNQLHALDTKGINPPGFEKAYRELLLKGPYPVVDYIDE